MTCKHHPVVTGVDDLNKDLAGTYKTQTPTRDIAQDIHEADWRHLQTHGYVLIKNLITDEQCVHIKRALSPLLQHQGRNAFEGHKTQRIYSVLNKTNACTDLVMHPRILALLDRMFMPNYLLSMLQAINILPGEKQQFLHTDDSFYPLARPRPPLGAATVWAIDDFTQANGATHFIPNSQHWDDRHPTGNDEVLQAIMPKGSVIFYGGTLWHGGGANQSDASRLAVTAQYCEPWVRPQENFCLSAPKSVVKALSPELQSMLGYSVMPPFIGQVDGMHPKRLLED